MVWDLRVGRDSEAAIDQMGSLIEWLQESSGGGGEIGARGGGWEERDVLTGMEGAGGLALWRRCGVRYAFGWNMGRAPGK